MFGNWWHKKERPILGLTGLMGGNSSGMISGAKEGKFTINGSSERPSKDGYATPVTVTGGSHFSLEVTSGPFTATVKMWGGGGAACEEGNFGGAGGFIQGDFDFQEGATYQFVKGGGGKRRGQGNQTYGGGGSGKGPNNAYEGGRGAGGGGYSGFFKAPGPTPAANTRAQDYAILIVGGGGGGGGSPGEAGKPGWGKWKMPTKGGSGGSAMPPADPPFANNYGGGNPQDPTEPHYPLHGQTGSGNGGSGAPRTTENPEAAGDGYGGVRGGGYYNYNPQTLGYGQALQGGEGAGGSGAPYGGGSGGGGGYWGGGGGGHNTNPSNVSGGGGGGFITVPAVHPEGISCPGPSIEGAIGMTSGQVNPFPTVPAPQHVKGDPVFFPAYKGANMPDPDRGDAGDGAMYGGDNYQQWTDANCNGNSGKVVIKES